MDTATALNPQVKFGSDLISCLQSCIDGKQDEMPCDWQCTGQRTL